MCDLKLDRQRHLIPARGGFVLSCIYIKPIRGFGEKWLSARGGRILANLTSKHSGHAARLAWPNNANTDNDDDHDDVNMLI